MLPSWAPDADHNTRFGSAPTKVPTRHWTPRLRGVVLRCWRAWDWRQPRWVQSKLVVDWNSHACATIRTNQALHHPEVAGWPLRDCDVREIDFRALGTVDLVSGGPPCQPFSLGGKHHGPLDARDMFPQAIRAVRELTPRAFVFENVPGLKRPAFSHYLGYIRDQLAFPEVTIRPEETWVDHARRLRREGDTANAYGGLAYRVQIETANAADFGVPQKRERMFMVGPRSDLEVDWTFPRATHSQDALLWQQWITGEYWDRHRIGASDRPAMPSRLRRRLEPFRGFDIPPPSKPWRTVRDALAGLSDPEFDPTSCRRIPNHRFNPGRAWAEKLRENESSAEEIIALLQSTHASDK